METCKHVVWIYKIILILIIFFFTQINISASTFNDLKKNKKVSYLDFIILKIENKLNMRRGILGPQFMAFRVQYQNVGTQVDFSNEDSKIIISIIGVMDKRRYTQKKYTPRVSDCNVLRNLLLYGKYGYSLIFQKRNKYLTNEDMEEIFLFNFLSNLSLSDKEKKHIVKNTVAKVEVIDPVRGKNVFCKGNVAEDLR